MTQIDGHQVVEVFENDVLKSRLVDGVIHELESNPSTSEVKSSKRNVNRQSP